MHRFVSRSVLSFAVVAVGIAAGAGCGAGVDTDGPYAQSLAELQDGTAEKAIICHVPPGDPANAHIIVVGLPAVWAHVEREELATGLHGDDALLTALTDACPPVVEPPVTVTPPDTGTGTGTGGVQ